MGLWVRKVTVTTGGPQQVCDCPCHPPEDPICPCVLPRAPPCCEDSLPAGQALGTGGSPRPVTTLRGLRPSPSDRRHRIGAAAPAAGPRPPQGWWWGSGHTPQLKGYQGSVLTSDRTYFWPLFSFSSPSPSAASSLQPAGAPPRLAAPARTGPSAVSLGAGLSGPAGPGRWAP